MFSSKLTAAVWNSNIPIVKVFVFRLEAVSRKGSREVSGKDFRPNSHSPLMRKKKKLSKQNFVSARIFLCVDIMDRLKCDYSITTLGR